MAMGRRSVAKSKASVLITIWAGRSAANRPRSTAPPHPNRPDVSCLTSQLSSNFTVPVFIRLRASARSRSRKA
eukprot:4889933-Prymnesium_polylepis.1